MDKNTLRYSPTHEWVLIEGNVATVGITRFAVEQLTDLITIELPKVGTRLSRGKSFGEIESVKSVSDLYAPVGGEVIEVNSAVVADLQVLAEDPYEKGWLIKLKVEPPVDTSDLLDERGYEAKVAEESH
jgi:glycine cleavage system H protein